MQSPMAQIRQRLRDLEKTKLVVRSVGTYPTKQRTPVADVARYQNDGTDRGIEPSRFIERAQESSDNWSDEISDGVADKVLHGDSGGLKSAAKKMAQDISATCDRIRTGQLKSSFEGEVTHD